MTIRFHRLVQKDVWDIMRFYEEEACAFLADEFYRELMVSVDQCGENPERFHFDQSGLRRANLRRFPFHFLYKVRRDDVLVVVLRHHNRHPSFGLHRK